MGKANRKPDLKPAQHSRFPFGTSCAPGVVPAPEPEQDVGLCRPPRRLLGQGGTANNCLGDPKSGLVCVCSFLCKDVGIVVSPFEQVGSAPSSTSRCVAWPLTLTALTSSRGNQKPAPDVCSGAPCTQGSALWPVDRRDGTCAVDVQRERVHGDDACHGSSVVFAIA